MGLGAALFESMRDPWEGPPGSYSIRPLRVPLMRDVPPLATHTVEDGSGPGQAGERGIGECSVVASMAAVLGACADAFGAPITRAPVGFFRDQPIGDEESK
jgi:CO/xanthine dehydrogenase Mo-binding subunit